MTRLSAPMLSTRWPRRSVLPLGILVALFVIVMAAPFCLRKQSDWDDVYLAAARHLIAGEDIFQNGYVYPPLAAWLAIPFTHLPRVPGRLAWYLVNVAAALVLFRGAWKLSEGLSSRAGGDAWPGGQEKLQLEFSQRRQHAVWLLGTACGIYYVFDAFSNQQIDLIVAALVIGGCLSLNRERTFAAATFFGVAAGLKCTPLLWGPYLFWKRRWKEAAWLVFVAVAINGLPDLASRPPHGWCWLAEWHARILQGMLGSNYDPGAWASAIQFNHSLAGVGNRWLVADWSWAGHGFHVFERPDRISSTGLKVIVYGLEGLLVAGTLLVLRPRASTDACGTGFLARPEEQDGLGRPSYIVAKPAAQPLEYSLVVLLMVLLSPMSSKPHFCTLLLPGYCIARLAVERRDRLLQALLLSAITMGLLSNKDLWGASIYTLVLWYGSVTWNALLLFGACVHARLRLCPCAVSEPLPGQTAIPAQAA